MKGILAVFVFLLIITVAIIAPAGVGYTLGGSDPALVAWMTALASFGINFLFKLFSERGE